MADRGTSAGGGGGDDDSDHGDYDHQNILTGNSRIEFHYYVKGTLGRKNRILYLELESQTIIFPDDVQLPISAILNTLKIPNSPGGLIVSIRGKSNKLQEKKWFFPSEAESSSFQKYLATLTNSGDLLYQIFTTFDMRQNRQFTWKDLRHVGLQYGNDIPPEDCKEMIHLLDANHNDYLDYIEFFQYFMNLPMITGVESCLLEWQNKYIEDLTSLQPRTSRHSILELNPSSPGTPSHQIGSNYFILDHQPALIPGEKMFNIIQHVRYTLTPNTIRSPKFTCVGNLYLTNYRLIFSSYRRTNHLLPPSSSFTRNLLPTAFEDLMVPLSCIQKIELLTAKGSKDSVYSIAIYCKDLRILRIAFDAKENFSSTFEGVLTSQAFPPVVKQVFAFYYKENFLVNPPVPIPPATSASGAGASPDAPPAVPPAAAPSLPSPFSTSSSSLIIHHGWNLYSTRREFSRQEVLQTDNFRIWCDNYQLVDTYPKEFILPQGIPADQIIEAAKFRSRNRLPALTFRNRRNGAVLCRSSQPLVGILAHRSLPDKLLLNLYRVRGNIHDPAEIDNPSDLYIMDCRKAIAATANSALGKGVEDEKHYDRTKVIFLEIENIHVMRTSLQMLEQVISQGLYLSASDSHYEDPKFNSKIEETEWLVHARRILKASVSVAEKLELERASVLVHCSDGWDRTAQVCATAQILLDPYFRTIEGLCVLIEKEWCSFGHKFHDRIGHCDPNTESSERSPVFIQWLDVLHQLLIQFPNQFQYQESLLIFLADAVYSCLFGTFLGNCERERELELHCESRTKSVWSYVMFHAASWTNPLFEEYPGPLWPATTQRNIKFWDRYFFRWEPEMHPRVTSGIKWDDDWGTKTMTQSEDGSSSNSIQNMKPIQINQHDNSSDSNISRPISVAHGRLPLDFNLSLLDPNPNAKAKANAARGFPSTIEEGNESGDDVIRRRKSRLNSL